LLQLWKLYSNLGPDFLAGRLLSYLIDPYSAGIIPCDEKVYNEQTSYTTRHSRKPTFNLIVQDKQAGSKRKVHSFWTCYRLQPYRFSVIEDL
jgi:hypothetical protein